MKNIVRIASSILYCCLCNPLTANNQEIYYYLQSSMEKPDVKVYTAQKYTQELDGRLKIEVLKYVDEDSIGIRDVMYFRKDSLTLYRYLGKLDSIGQVYLKVQPDTSFIFKYDDPMINKLFGSVSRYLGKAFLQKDDQENEYYKFRLDQNENVFYLFLTKEFLLEQLEVTLEDYYHYLRKRVDSSEVPKRFREKVERFEGSNAGINDTNGHETCVPEQESWFNGNLLYSACSVIVFLIVICFYISRTIFKSRKNN